VDFRLVMVSRDVHAPLVAPPPWEARGGDAAQEARAPAVRWAPLLAAAAGDGRICQQPELNWSSALPRRFTHMSGSFGPVLQRPRLRIAPQCHLDTTTAPFEE
jgi:hypothetical protein